MQARFCVFVASLLAVSVVGVPASGGEGEPLEATLRQVVEDHLAAYDREDAAAALKLIHTQSPEYAKTKKAIAEQFRDQEATTELVAFRYIGHDDEFAVARVKMRTVAPGDAAFADNVVDSITLFHQEAGVWKYWSDYVLGVEIVE